MEFKTNFGASDYLFSEDCGLRELAKWILEAGGFISDSLELYRDDDCGYSARVISAPSRTTLPQIPSDISESPRTLMSCPASLIFSLYNPKPNLPASFLESPSLSIHAKACFHLCQNILEGEKGKFWPYIKLLPLKFHTPLYFTEDEMQRLTGTNLGAGDVEIRRRKWVEEWKEGRQVLYWQGIDDLENYTWELYLRAATIYTSRSFPSELLGIKLDERLPLNDTKGFPVLIPLIDLLNHKPNTKIIWKPSPGSFSVQVPNDLPVGSQLFNNYGPKANEELLMGYGFVIANNPVDSVAIKFKIAPTGLASIIWAKRPAKSQWSETFHLIKSVSQKNGASEALLEDEWPSALVDLFRILVATEHELQILEDNPTKTPVSARNEIAVALNLKRAVAQKLGNLQNFDQSSSKPPKSENESMADIYRDGQKEIMISKLESLDSFLQSFAIERRISSKDCLDANPSILEFINENPIPTFYEGDEEVDQIIEDGELVLLIAFLQAYFSSPGPDDMNQQKPWTAIKDIQKLNEQFGLSYIAWVEANELDGNSDSEGESSEYLALKEYCHSIPGLDPKCLTGSRLLWAWGVIQTHGIKIDDSNFVLAW